CRPGIAEGQEAHVIAIDDQSVVARHRRHLRRWRTLRADDGDFLTQVKSARRQIPRVKRSPHLIAHWRGSQLVIRNYALGTASLCNPLVCAVLDLCSDWQTLAGLKKSLPPEIAGRL